MRRSNKKSAANSNCDSSPKNGVREIAILKCDNAAKGHWVIHNQEEEIIGEATPDDMDDLDDLEVFGGKGPPPPPPLHLRVIFP